MDMIQSIVDKCTDLDCHLPKAIYSAPLIINKPCKIYGNGSIILCDGNSIIVEADGVEFYDIKIEQIAEQTYDLPVVICKQDTLFHNTIVNGTVKRGDIISEEQGIPNVLNIGSIKPNVKNTFSFDINVDESSEIFSDNNDLSFIPSHLQSGLNNVTLVVDSLYTNLIIHSCITVKGIVDRIFLVIGKVSNDAEDVADSKQISFETQDSSISVKNPTIIPLLPNTLDNEYQILNKGQRMALNGATIVIQLDMDALEKTFDIDGYAFILNQSGKVDGDEGLIFWGNKTADDKFVELVSQNEKLYFYIRTDKISNKILKIVLCYSIYGNDPDETFRYVKNPYIRILVNGIEEYRFYLKNLYQEKTIVAVEIYSNNSNWKINCVGSGYNAGLKRLCENYGIEIAD